MKLREHPLMSYSEAREQIRKVPMFDQAFKNIDDVLWKEAWIKRRIG